MIPFGMRPQIHGWPFRLGGDISQVGSTRGPWTVAGVLLLGLLHPVTAVHLLWDLRVVAGPIGLYLGVYAVCAFALTYPWRKW